MALLVRVLVSEGMISCGCPRARVGVGEDGVGEAGRKCTGGVCAAASLRGN